ncbi:glycerol kinase-like [Metopolophium dirhodum]|uniref:glycerol kinase-like n=1 Tax=Metopolophium dirhodum TaxID=44670 RepID=UPI0029908088|nr:glycerol kinase-like [Metopolophium dirhodum]XP_060856832.1 glycerol kinase-like [Metopolophium dirhodum]XP_060856833.1 glycerol kinase-like [Metopolophium dirhodum]
MSKTHNLICDKRNNAQQSMSAAEEKFVGVIDEGVSSTRFLVFSSKTQLPVASDEISVTNISSYEGWVEQDPENILIEVKRTIVVTCKKLKMMNISPSVIAAIGVTNQRDTTLVWDKYTGSPLYNAIIWMDMMTTQSIVNRFINKRIPNCDTLDEQKRHLQYKCGSTINPYFSVVKLIWLMENIPQVSKAIQEERCMFGTMDSWLIWNLTGGINGGVHITDVTNASRTMLMNIHSLRWDKTLIEFFDIPKSLIFPDIRSCSEVYGVMTGGPFINTPISGCIGDHQGALLGQLCFTAGQAKCTFGSNCFLLYNTGRKPVISTHGLLTTVAYKIGKHSDPIYALEGSVTVAEYTTEWLKDNLWIMDIYKSTEAVQETNNIHFVPAFSELYAPFWKTGTDGKCTGVTMETTEAHLMRETLERICFQTNEVMQSMQSDTGHPVMALNVDGGMSTNDTFLKILTNICCLPVVRPKMLETTALGAALAAGFAVGVWNINSVESNYDTFIHTISKEEQKSKCVSLKKTIDPNKSLNKIDEENENDDFAGF